MSPDVANSQEPLQSIFEELSSRNLIHGLQCSTQFDGRVNSYNFGFASPEVSMTDDHIGPWLCASKPLVAYAIINVLSEAGLDIDAEIRAVDPTLASLLPPDTSVADCMSHRFTFDMNARNPVALWRSHLLYEGVISGVRDQNSGVRNYDIEGGWAIAASIAERITGNTFEEIMHQFVLDPFELSNSTYRPLEACSPNRRIQLSIPEWNSTALCHNIVDLAGTSGQHLRPGFGLWTTANDMSQFYAKLETSDPICEMMLRARTNRLTVERRNELTYGLGIYINGSVHASASKGSYGHDGLEVCMAFRDGSVAVAMFLNGLVASPLVELIRQRSVLHALRAMGLPLGQPARSKDA